VSSIGKVAPWGALAVVLAGATVAYSPALNGEFHFDDWVTIQSNMVLRGPEALNLPSVARLLGPDRAVTQFTFALDYREAGLRPFRYHLVNLLLHLATAILAFLFAREILRRTGHRRAEGLAVIAAGLFALHPIQSEAVAYTAQRSEVLASLFFLLCVLMLDRAASAGRVLRIGAFWMGGLAAWLLAMGSKTIAITAPAIFVLDQAVIVSADGGERNRLGRRTLRALGLALPFLLLASWSALQHLRYFAATPGAGVGTGSSAPSPAAYFLTQLRVQWLYLRLLAWPDSLTLDRSFTASQYLDGPTTLAAAGLLAVLALAGWLWFRAERSHAPAPGQRVAAFGILFWFLVLAPTSTFVPVVDLAVEHRVYLAALGPILAVVVGGDALVHRLLTGRRATLAGWALAGVALLALGMSLEARAHVWSTEEGLWRDAAVKSPGNARVLTSLGRALKASGNFTAAEIAYRKAWTVAREPAHIAQLARNHGALLESVERSAEALEILDRGLEVFPDNAELHLNRAVALAQLDRYPEAVEEARRAVASGRGDPAILNAYGEILAYGNNWEEASSAFRGASRVDPGSPTYFTNQALPLFGTGRTEEGCRLLREAEERYGAARLPKVSQAWRAQAQCPP
jgi:tetratricopeptide (TPR) repeat protein